MATHSSILAWRIPWTKEPGRLQSIGSQKAGCNWAHTHTQCIIYNFYCCVKQTKIFLKILQHQFSHSVISDSTTPRTAAHQASLSITNSQSLLKLMSIKSAMLSNHLILCHHLLLPSIFPSTMAFSSELVLPIRWPKYYGLWSEWIESCSVVSNSLQPHGLYGPWNSPGQNTGVGGPSLL